MDDLNLPPQGRGDSTSAYYTQENMQRELDAMLAEDSSVMPALNDSLSASFQLAPEEDTPPAGVWASLWGRMKRAHQKKEEIQKKTGEAILRGGLKAVDELSNAVVSVGALIDKTSGLYKLVNDEQGEKDFLLWYEQRTKEVNPFQFGEERIDRWLPQSPGIGYALVEGVSQFAAGFAVLGGARLLTAAPKAVGLAAASVPRAVQYLKIAGSASVVDMTFFDPYADRLSNIVENGPEWLSNPVTQFLAADDDDTGAEGRLKNALEGFVLGSVVDGFLAMARGARVRMRQRAGKISEAAAQESVAQGLRPISETEGRGFEVTGTRATPEVPVNRRAALEDMQALTRRLEQARDAFVPAPNGNGQWVVVPADEAQNILRNIEQSGFAEGKPAAGVEVPIESGYPTTVYAVKQAEQIVGGPDELKRLAQEELASRGGTEADVEVAGASLEDTARRIVNEHSFKTQAEAQQAAAAGNFYLSNAQKPVEFTDEMRGQWQQVADRLAAGENAEDIARLMQGTEFNFNYISQPKEVLAAVEAMADVLPSEIRLKGKAVQTHAETIALAKGMFKDLSGEQVVDGAASLFRSTEKLPQKITALRAWLIAQGKVARKLSQLAEMAPDNAIAHDHLMGALDTMGDLYGHLSGTVSNVARTLEAQKIRVGNQLVNPAAKKIEDALDDLRTSRTVRDRIAQTADPEALAAADAQVQRALRQAGELTGQKAKPPKPDANPLEELTASLDEADRQLQQHLDKAKSTGNGSKAPKETSPVTDFIRSNKAPSNGRRVAAGRTKAELRALSRQVFLADGDPAEILAAITTPKIPAEAVAKAIDPRDAYKKFWDRLISFRMEAMLSGPKTQVTNIVGNAISSFQRPIEYWWGGLRTNNPALKQMGSDTMTGLFSNIGESWRAAKKSWSMGQNILDPGNTHTGMALAPWGEASFFSKVFHTPSRLLMTSDEFFKQLNYRGHMQAQILRQAASEGVTDAAQLAARMSDDMNFIVNEQTGMAVNPVALQYSRVGTFTNELADGTIGKWLQGGQRHPAIRFILPFVRTPVNIFRYAWERTPVLNRAMKEFREELAAGGERAAIAQAKSELGGFVWASAALLAYNGAITGRGPSDPELRQQWREAGYQPYSIKIPGTNRWISYRRADPSMAAMGIAADLVSMMGELGDEDRSKMVYAFMASIAANVTSKTFMQGVTDFMEAAYSGRADVMEHLASTSLGSFVPNVLRQMDPNDTIRETRGLVEEMFARVPGLSETLEPRRNMFGEKIMKAPGYLNQSINPFTVSGSIEPDVADELLKLGRAFTMPPERKAGGMIDLTSRTEFSNGTRQSPYDRMLELMGNGMNGSMPALREALTNLVQMPEYQAASDGGTVARGGVKYMMASALVMGYQNAAWATVLQEYPKLIRALTDVGQLRADDLSTMDQDQALLNR